MFKKKISVRLGTAGAAAVLGTLGAFGGQASATPVHPDGFEPTSVVFEPTSVVTDASCKGWMNTEKQNGNWFAQGLVQSWNGQSCYMYLERLHNGSWTMVSSEHHVAGNADNTGWYWDDSGYKSRVCIWNASGSQTWKCGGAV
ncbi:hypothetical protein ACFY0F_26605 [Streptomyces sp. NPDC001544]|uniref:hypothetical protein n=1 Tax=Streptomyces sp. NPDC001544 TaxID=3364584 RepID=UPI0036902E7E